MPLDKYDKYACQECEGSGKEDPNCEECLGYGWVKYPSDGGTMSCPKCDGTDCAKCNGTGEISDG